MAATAAPPPPDAAAQAARAVVAIAPIAADGTTRVDIALTPQALGHVSISIARAADGSTSIAVAAASPRTLDALKNDQDALGQALTAAGVPEAQRSISFAVQPAPRIEADPGLNAAFQGNAQNGMGESRQPQPDARGGAAPPPAPAMGTMVARPLPAIGAARSPPARPTAAIDLYA